MPILKIAWDNSLASQDKAGTGVYASRLLEQFLSKQDIRVEVLDGWYHGSTSGLVGRGVRTLKNLFWMHAYLPRLLSRLHADVLHAPAFVSPSAAPCPVVVTVHDIAYLLYPSHFSRWWIRYMRTIMPSVMSSAAAIICGSEHSRNDIIRAYGVSPGRVRVVPYGVDHIRFHPGIVLDSTWAHSVGINNEYVLHIGTFSHRKNIPTLLHAIARLRNEGQWGQRQLVLAGSQTSGMKGAAVVFDTIEKLGLQDAVIVTGHVPEKFIPGLYAGARVLVMPSLYEGFGFPVLESMAVGTPVVASGTSSLPEVAGDAALFCPPNDHESFAQAIEAVLGNPALVKELRQKGIERSRQFTWQRTAQETLQIYQAVARS